MTPWSAPLARRPLSARVALPGSKSLTNRYLVLAALADSPSEFSGVLRARDAELMMAALQALGTRIDADGELAHVTPGPLRGARIECGLAGTVMRFIAPIAALATGESRLDGDPAARRRPLAPLLGALQDLGVLVTSDDGRLPVSIVGAGRLDGGSVSLDASGSSQFLSALLLAAPAMRDGLTLSAAPDASGRILVPSRPHIDMTLDALRRFGATATALSESAWRVEPGALRGQCLAIEPDLSNAGPFLAAALAAGGRVEVANWPERTTQAGALLPDLLTAMGARVERDGDRLACVGTGSIAGLDADMADCGELVPTIAALAVLASTPSHLSGIGHLAGHETDRLAALTNEITRLGARAKAADGVLTIVPPAGGPDGLTGGRLRSYEDHRMATFGAIVGLRVPGTSVDDIGATSKTLPAFPQLWQEMLDGTGP